MRTILIGVGSLGRAFLRALRDHETPIELVGVMSARHGRILAVDGVDPALALNLVESEGLGESAPSDFNAFLDQAKADLLIECVPQNIRTAEPALGFLRAALDRGMHAITSNKAAIVLGYRDLLHRAANTGKQIRFESTVLDGVPLFSTVASLEGLQIDHVRGVLNGTSSLVLESVQGGGTRSRGLARAQALGIAEADSVLDLDGWDAAAKTALVANVLMGGALRVFDVSRIGCEALKDKALKATPEEQAHFRLVSDISRQPDGGLRAVVEPKALECGDPLFALRGAACGLTIQTNGAIHFTMLQEAPGLPSAAMGILQDCYAIARGSANRGSV